MSKCLTIHIVSMKSVHLLSKYEYRNLKEHFALIFKFSTPLFSIFPFVLAYHFLSGRKNRAHGLFIQDFSLLLFYCFIVAGGGGEEGGEGKADRGGGFNPPGSCERQGVQTTRHL